ncbi:hypothetical protein SCHPADRAFT_238824 [Schizopora paradoxa]|uniref:Uncharacterized protein n=1 Tax=Schizopora paradoxa TaxID=27342 RepID=A0A0H2SG24_9AGAM|nr:hypothetical protein SCHPADRAFT_238824 [Schizopora paradoxa]
MIMAAQEVRRHMPGLLKLAARDFPGVPRKHLGYIIDCTSVPLKFSHFRIDNDVDGEGPTQSHARPELRRMVMKSEGKAALISLRLLQGTGCQERDIIVEVLEDDPRTARGPGGGGVRFPRMVGRDFKGNVLETRADAVDYMLSALDIRDPVSWLTESPTPVKHLCDRIDQYTKDQQEIGGVISSLLAQAEEMGFLED